MPKQVYEMTNFNKGIVSTVSDADAKKDTLAYSLNLDPCSILGRVDGIQGDVETGDITPTVHQSLKNNTFFQLKDGTTAFASSTGTDPAIPRVYSDPLGSPTTVSGLTNAGLISSISEYNGMVYFSKEATASEPQMFTQYQHKHKGEDNVPPNSFNRAHLDRLLGKQGYTKIATARNGNDNMPSPIGGVYYALGVKDNYIDVDLINLSTGETTALAKFDIRFNAPASLCFIRDANCEFYILDDNDNLATIHHIKLSTNGGSLAVTRVKKWDIRELRDASSSNLSSNVYPNVPITDIESGGKVGAGDQRIYIFSYVATGLSIVNSGDTEHNVILYTNDNSSRAIFWGVEAGFDDDSFDVPTLLTFPKKPLISLPHVNVESSQDYQQCGCLVNFSGTPVWANDTAGFGYSQAITKGFAMARFGNADGTEIMGGIGDNGVIIISPESDVGAHLGGVAYVTSIGTFGDNKECLYMAAMSKHGEDDKTTLSTWEMLSIDHSFSNSPDNDIKIERTSATSLGIVGQTCVTVGGPFTDDGSYLNGDFCVSFGGFSGGMRTLSYTYTYDDVDYCTIGSNSTVIIEPNEFMLVTRTVNQRSSLSATSLYRYKIAYQYDLVANSPLSEPSVDINPALYYFGGEGDANERTALYETQSIRLRFTIPTTFIAKRINGIVIYRAEIPGNVANASAANYRRVTKISLTEKNDNLHIDGNENFNISYVDNGEAGETYSEGTGLSESQETCTPSWALSCVGQGSLLIGNCANVEDVDDTSTFLFLSEFGKPLQFNTLMNFVKLREVPVCMQFWNGRFYVATENYLYKINPNGGLAVEDEIFGIGCEGPDAMFANDYGFIIAARQQIYFDTGSGMQPIGEAIKQSDQGVGWLDRDTTVAPNVSYLESKQCFVIHHKNGNAYYLYAYSPIYQAWYLWETLSNGGLCVGPGTGLYGVVSGAKKLWKIATSATRRAWSLVTQKMGFPNQTTESKVYDVRVATLGGIAVNASLDVDGVESTLLSNVTHDNRTNVYKCELPARGSLYQVTLGGSTEIEALGVTYRGLTGIRSTPVEGEPTS
jgi:hypothetical protein